MSKRNQLNVLVVLLAFVMVATNASAVIASDRGVPNQIIYVDAQAAGVENGQSWTDAYTDLQAALSEARGLAPAQDIQIWVAEGVYRPATVANPSFTERFPAFELINGVEIYGGFAGGESALDERDWRANPTVLSGDIDSNDIVNAIGVTEHFDDIVGDNALHVVRAQDVDDSAQLDGFFITGGLANLGGLVDGTFSMRRGAGIYLLDSQVHLARLQVQGNEAVSGSSGDGGGAYFDRGASVPGTPVTQLSDVHFINNRSVRGGGLYIDGPETSIDGAVVTGNVASTFGGGLVKVITVVDIRNASITDNQAADGGGIYSFRGTAAIVNTQISGNYASQNGGGIYFDQAPSLDTWVVLTNSTLSGNRTDGVGGGIYHEQPDVGRMLINNSVFWNNQDSSGLDTADSSYGGPGASRIDVSHSLIQGLDPAGEGNIDGTIASNDPLFADPIDPLLAPTAQGDLRVAGTSPIIDRGTAAARINVAFNDTTPPPVPIGGEIFLDLDGNPRFLDGSGDGISEIDLGPFEIERVTFSVGGEVAGLNGDGLVLLLNDSEALLISDDGPFAFATELSGGSSYTVVMATQPIRPPQLCQINNASGEVSGAVTDVEVICTNRADELFDDRFVSM